MAWNSFDARLLCAYALEIRIILMCLPSGDTAATFQFRRRIEIEVEEHLFGENFVAFSKRCWSYWCTNCLDGIPYGIYIHAVSVSGCIHIIFAIYIIEIRAHQNGITLFLLRICFSWSRVYTTYTNEMLHLSHHFVFLIYFFFTLYILFLLMWTTTIAFPHSSSFSVRAFAALAVCVCELCANLYNIIIIIIM